jgi:hypothetical protein
MKPFARWDEVKDMHRLWWARANERPYVWVTAPLPGDPNEEPVGFAGAPAGSTGDEEATIRQWTDPDIVVARAERGIARTYYAGMAHPGFWYNLGPSIASAYLGCPLVFSGDTSWQEPIVRDWDEFMSRLDGLVSFPGDRIRFTDPQGQRWWQATLDVTRLAAERAQQGYMVGLTDLGDCFDIMSHLRRPGPLCTDLVDSPDVLVTLRDWLTRLWFRLHDELTAIIRRHQEGSSSCIGLWSPGTSYPLQCDFSCMVSPRMYEEYILPEVVAFARGLDHTIYHLDGVDAIKHLDLILSVPEIDAIQWVPGEGRPTAVHWIPMLEKIQRAGKGLFVFAEGIEEVRTLARSLRPEGLLIVSWASSVDAADALAAAAQ